MGYPTTSNTTLEYFDGFDDYNASQAILYWNYINSPTSITIPPLGRNSSNCLRFTDTSAHLGLFLPPQPTRTIGFAFRFDQTPTPSSSPWPILSLVDDFSTQLTISLSSTYNLLITRGTSTILATLPFPLTPQIFHYLEFSSTIHPTIGSIFLHIDSTSHISLSSQNTQSSANSSANRIYLGFLPSASSPLPILFDYDDLYIRSDSTFMNDQRVETRLPISNGSIIQFTPIPSVPNYQNVDDPSHDSDATYNYAIGTDVSDLYLFPPLDTTSGTVHAIMTVALQSINKTGAVFSQSIYRPTTTNFYAPSISIAGGFYGAYSDIQGLNPESLTPWTISSANSSQFGLKRI